MASGRRVKGRAVVASDQRDQYDQQDRLAASDAGESQPSAEWMQRSPLSSRLLGWRGTNAPVAPTVAPAEMPPIPSAYTPAPDEAEWTQTGPLIEVSLREYDQLGRKIDELYGLLKQCDQELAQLNHRKTIETASLRQMEEKLELYGRQQISEAYHSANEAEMRAFMMGEEREQLATTIGVYERYRQYLKRAINVLGSAHQPPAPPPQPRQPQQPHAPTLAQRPQRPQRTQNYPAPVAPQWRPPTAPDAEPLWPAPTPQQQPPLLPEVPPMGLTSRFQGPEQTLGEVTTYFPPEAYAEHPLQARPPQQGSQAAGQVTPPAVAGAQAGQSQRDPLTALTVARIIQSQEELRLRIAQQLHDGPTQSLSNVALTAEFCEKAVQSDPQRALGELGHLKRLVNEALQQTRAFIFELRPMTLDDLGLAPTLRRYAAEQMARYEREHEVGAAPLEIEVQTPRGEARLPHTVETALFRVAQEAISNAIIHGAAQHILVTILVAPDHVRLTIDDDGRGFDVDEALAWAMIRHSTGLTSMQERAEMLSGWLVPLSERGKGSRIEISAPLPPRREPPGG